MKILNEEIDDSQYVDVYVSKTEAMKIIENEMIMGEMEVEGKKFYVGVCLDYFDDFEEKD